MGEFLVGLTALTLFGSVIWFWLMFALFIIICFASDIKKDGYYAFGTLVVVSIVLYFGGNETFSYFKSAVWNLKNISIYLGLGLGLGFASIRTFTIELLRYKSKNREELLVYTDSNKYNI
jgi:hypothetical protein